jgi:formylglycine-generating enzyme required for sulfatase activity
MIKKTITLNAFAVLVLSAVIATPSFAQIKKDLSVTTPGASPNKVTTVNLRLGQTFRDCPECPEMIVIPAGTFTMGSPANEPGRYDVEGPQRSVSIRQFAVGKFDVTRGQWAAFVSATNRPTTEGCAWSGFKDTTRKAWENNPKASWRNLGLPQDDSHPVVCITWNDAQDYVRWLSKQTGSNYRLLTESEWEYAARAGTSTPFPWGSSPSHEYANYGADSGSYEGLASGRDQWVKTSPVGSFPPNAFGLYDMQGNVLQYVEDCFSYSYSGLPTDGSAYQVVVELKMTGRFSFMNGTSSCSSRMVRGGDWGDPPRMIRSAYRNWAPGPGFTLENYRSGGVGFRVAKTL